MQGSPYRVERVAVSAAVPPGVLLDSSSALVEGRRRPGGPRGGVHHRHRVGEFFGMAVLNRWTRPSRRPRPRPARPVGRSVSHVLKTSLGQPSTMLSSCAGWCGRGCRSGRWSRSRAFRAPGVPPRVLVDADHSDAVVPAQSPIRTHLPTARITPLAVRDDIRALRRDERPSGAGRRSFQRPPGSGVRSPPTSCCSYLGNRLYWKSYLKRAVASSRVEAEHPPAASR